MTSLTQRQSGIVQRRRAKDGAEGGTNVATEDTDMPQEDIDDEDRDSKETRLTLMEEILLLGLKDREVRSFWHNIILKFYLHDKNIVQFSIAQVLQNCSAYKILQIFEH